MAGKQDRRTLTRALLLGASAFAPALYPAWLAASASRHRGPVPPEPQSWPSLTVVVPAYREEETIVDKVADLRDNGYPGPLQIVVIADDPDTARAALQTDAEVIEVAERLGKAEALNRGFAAARCGIVVFTDANTRLTSGSLSCLTRWFEDPGVGAAAGEKRVEAVSQGLYWQFESWLKRLESRRGTTVGLVGELGAVRRSLYRPLPPDLAVDDLWLGLDVIESGSHIRYEPEAVAWEKPSLSLGEEWERRTRIICGVIDVLWRRRRLLIPSRSPVAAELWGHRLARSSFGPLAHAALLVDAFRSCRHSLAARLFLGVHLVGAVGLAREQRGQAVSRPERVTGQVLFLQAAAIGGLTRYLRGDRPAKWRKAKRTAGPPRSDQV